MPKKVVSNSGWDQFCDFTSLVGFRLLHSNQPLWIRGISAILMIICTVLICLQSLYFWTKFRQSAGQRVATVTRAEGQPLRQPRFLVCVTRQTPSLSHGHGGSVDFRQLVYNYQMEEKLEENFIKQLQTEMSMVEKFFEDIKNITETEDVRDAGMRVARKLRLLREIRAALWFDYANFTVPSVPDKLYGTSEGFRFERSRYASLRSSLDRCLAIFLLTGIKMQNSTHFSEFLHCRIREARRLHTEFDHLQSDYFAYARKVWMDPRELIVKSAFFPSGDPGLWAPSWQVESGLCALGGPRGRRSVIKTHQKGFDQILIRTNRLEAHPNSRIYVHLMYEKPMESDQQNGELIRANSFELVAGKHLEVTLRGMSEILDENCRNKYESGCVPSNFTYTPEVCRWCQPAIRKACPCANPDLYLPQYVGDYGHNCSLLEAFRCGPIQRELYHKADCPIPCMSVEYTADSAAYELSLDMLDMDIDSVQHQFIAEQLQLVDKINEYKFPHRWTKGGPWAKDGTQAKIWKATAQLSRFLDDYYAVMVSIYRLVYGESFSFPTLFAEDIVGLLGQAPDPAVVAPLSRLTELDLAKLDSCGQHRNGSLSRALVRIGTIYMSYFRNNTFRMWYPWFPCPVSISNLNCRILLNDSANNGDLQAIQEIIASSSYRQGTLELALTLNSTPPNLISIAQFYHQSEGKLRALNETMRKVHKSLNRYKNLLDTMIKNGIDQNQTCLEAKFALVQQMLMGNGSTNWPILAEPRKGRWNNEWFERFNKFLAQNSGARLLPDYLTSNMALFTVHYRGLTFQHIVYRDGYTIWELLSDLGGILGLYFGLTIITAYELLVFGAMVDRRERAIIDQ